MKRLLALLMTASALGGTGTAAAAPLIAITVKPGPISEAANKGTVSVEMTVPEVDIAPGEPFVTLGTATPGAGRPQPVVDMTATDSQGVVPVVMGKEPGRWTSSRTIKGDLAVRYRLPLENVPPVAGGPPINLRIDGDGVSGQTSGLIAAPKVSKSYRIQIHWDLSAMGAGAEVVSSFGDGDVNLPEGPVSRLAHTVFMAGHMKHEDHGAFSAVWTGEPPFDPRASMVWTAQFHKWMSVHFKDKEEPPYRVILRFNPMNAGGGAAFPHSFLATYGKGVTGENLKSILGHEMTHTWTANDVGKWYSEGNAVYYQALLPWRAGLFTADQYLDDLNETASRYYTNPMKKVPEAEVVPRFWEDTRIRVLPYDRGAMYFAVLNGKIVRASGGKRSIDDLIQVMVDRARLDQPATEQVWYDLLKQEIGDEGQAITKSMLAGGLMLPESGDFGPCFRRTTKKIRMFDLGFDPKSIVSPDKIITGLKPDSEAAKAGLKDGDKIGYGVAMDAVQGDVNRTLTYQVTRDGKTFPITYLPRGTAVDAYQWERVPGASATQCK